MNLNKIFMIIDDDVDDIVLFCEAIAEIFPFSKCLTANDGKDALEKLNEHTSVRPDFIFLDLNMPRMDGMTCLTHLKKDDNLKDIPVIIHSTSSSWLHMEEAKRLGASHYLSKPTSFKQLCKDLIKSVELVLHSKT